MPRNFIRFSGLLFHQFNKTRKQIHSNDDVYNLFSYLPPLWLNWLSSKERNSARKTHFQTTNKNRWSLKSNQIKPNRCKMTHHATTVQEIFLNFCFFFFFFVWQMLCVLYYYYYYYFVRRSRFERKRSNLVSWKEVKRNKGAGSVCVCVEWNCVWRGFFRNFFFCDHFFFKVAWWIFFFFFYYYSIHLDVPLLAGFGFKVLSRSANEFIIITIFTWINLKDILFARKIGF